MKNYGKKRKYSAIIWYFIQYLKLFNVFIFNFYSKLLRDDKELMACILETIGQLNISKEEIALIQMDMIPVIYHTPLEILPALVRFLIKVDDRVVAEKVSF